MIGTTILGYEILQALGQGGMGHVFLACSVDTHGLVAVKFLAPATAGDSTMLPRFRREHALLRELSHPRIVRVLSDLLDHEGRLFFAMEYVPGRSLGSVLLEQGPRPLPEAARILDQVLDGLQAAHDRGIAHCDLKPDNILLQDDGGLKIGDWGISKVAGATTLTATGQLFGSPHVMAPEIWHGERPGVSSDLYAAGVLFFWMLAGRPPFDGETVPRIMKGHLDDPVPGISGVPEASAVRRFLARALAKAPESRCASAKQMRVELASAAPGALQQSPPLLSQPTAPAGAPRRPPRRRPLPWILAGIALVAAALGVLAGSGSARAPTVAVHLRDGSVVTGLQVELDGGGLQLQTADGLRRIPLSEIRRVVHAPP